MSGGKFMTLGEKIKYLRNERGLYQRDLANALNIAVTTISGYERDDRRPNPETLKQIADFFGVTIDYLVGGKESSVDYLEEEFPEGIKVLRRATKELTPEARAKMVKLMKAFLEDE
ncbi:helix-turn-helix transcriptional regulator [Vallitalea guaymasensis]|uniref:Helix-turn-helix transcriptional regulator n=2 Tax=Vallitalea TaxID=1348611 RepID=A0A8J8MAY1_9FIRM|nr:helix-turn-helix transcriptional regulator [Vallitalea guaymasensis]